MNITSLRAAITAAGGTPVHFAPVELLRELVTVFGGTPTQFSVIGLLREAITAKSGTPLYFDVTNLQRQLLTTLGTAPAGYDQGVLDGQLVEAVTPAAHTPGPDLIVDPHFTTPADWSLTSTVTISANAAHWAASVTGRSVQPNPALTITPGVTYRCTIVVDAISSGAIQVLCGNASSLFLEAPGTYVQDILAAGTGNATLRANSAAGTTADVSFFQVNALS